MLLAQRERDMCMVMQGKIVDNGYNFQQVDFPQFTTYAIKVLNFNY